MAIDITGKEVEEALRELFAYGFITNSEIE
jgi:hypothetical protein